MLVPLLTATMSLAFGTRAGDQLVGFDQAPLLALTMVGDAQNVGMLWGSPLAA